MLYKRAKSISVFSEKASLIADKFKPKATLNELCSQPLTLPQDFTITCHAGAMGTADNDLNSLRVAVEWGAQVVEMDVTFRPDGTPCVIHKAEPTQDDGADFEKALEIVSTGSDSCKINLDLKSYGNLPEVDRLVKKHGLWDRVFYTGVNDKSVEKVRMTSAIPYFLNTSTEREGRSDEAYAQALADKIKALGAIGLNSHFLNISKAITDVLHKNGLLVSGWTANTMLWQCRLLSMGVDNITTRKPSRLKYCIEHWGKL